MTQDNFLLWQMFNQKAMGMKGNVILALGAYTRRTGFEANVVEVNEADIEGEEIECVGFEIQAVKTVLQGTISVGRRENGSN